LLALGGVAALWIGYKLFRTKAGHVREKTLVQFGTWKIQTSSIGASVMLTASSFGWLASTVAPKSFKSDASKIEISSLTSELPPSGEFLVSTRSGGASKHLECRKEKQDIVCFPIKPGQKCGPAPTFIGGLARLQVAAVPGAGSAQDALAANQERQLRQFLADRREKDWALHVMNYVGKEKDQSVRRVVFNGVTPELEKPICAWLVCEGWTFGPCAAVPNLRDDVP
jgi:hypothetical protein